MQRASTGAEMRAQQSTRQPTAPALPLLRTPEGDEQTSSASSGQVDTRQQATVEGDGGEGQLMVVEEEFQPEQYDALPDEDLSLTQIGPGEGREQQSQGRETAVAAPVAGFSDGGRIGTVRYGDAPVASNDLRPHAFTNGGRTGTVVWAGGGGAGAHGNEGAGSIQAQVAPVYESKSNGIISNSDAWVRAGTGTLDVKRSWVGINAGDQGNGHYVTAGAAARINAHETLHVASTQGHYNTHIVPLLARVADRSLGRRIAYTQRGAINSLRSIIRWPETVTNFQNADLADNQPMGTVDTNDLASGTYPVDAGPGNVGGLNVQHIVRLPAEPNPH